MCVYVYQWFSSFNMHQNHLEDLLKHRLFNPSLRVSESMEGPEDLYSKFQIPNSKCSRDHPLRTAGLYPSPTPRPHVKALFFIPPFRTFLCKPRCSSFMWYQILASCPFTSNRKFINIFKGTPKNTVLTKWFKDEC